MVHTGIRNLKPKPFGGAYSIHDEDTVRAKNEAIQKFIRDERSMDPDKVKKDYLETFRHWMFSTHNVIGHEEYDQACFCHGTTEAFSQFYIRYRNAKRLRIKKGDYFYHSMMQKLWYGDNFAWLDDDDIEEGDVLILSVPFAETGDVPDDLETILQKCDEKSVPVFIDMAYLNIAQGMEINLDHPCIEYVASSLSKAFPVELNRIGIRLQKKKFEDQLYVINEDGYNYINLQNCYVGTELMKNFPADYTSKKYRKKQSEYCDKMQLTPSRCVIFGIDYNNKYPEYKRLNDTARLCFSRVWDGRMSI